MKKLKILVFPCGSEIGLEIYRSLKYSVHVELLGVNSIEDHGKFVYNNYIGNAPFIDDVDIISFLAKLVSDNRIDAIYPAMDKVIWKLKSNESALGCKIIASETVTTEICVSKRKTYQTFYNVINTPKLYISVKDITTYPVFVKPDVGYGSRGVSKINNKYELDCFFHSRSFKDYVVTEFLPGEEYTVDCFTDRFGDLRFSGPRVRGRISNGISVNTKPVIGDVSEFKKIAVKINKTIKLQGAWFFQVKRSCDGSLVLLEVASRLGGSSGLFRGWGVNFPLLSIFDAFCKNIEIMPNVHDIEMDRALDNKYKINIIFSTIYVDFDDCLIINNKVNYQLIGFLFSCLNNGKKIILITKHKNDLNESLERFRLIGIFDEIIHISDSDNKNKYIKETDCIFIDDSFSERRNIKMKKNIHVFSPDMIETLL